MEIQPQMPRPRPPGATPCPRDTRVRARGSGQCCTHQVLSGCAARPRCYSREHALAPAHRVGILGFRRAWVAKSGEPRLNRCHRPPPRPPSPPQPPPRHRSAWFAQPSTLDSYKSITRVTRVVRRWRRTACTRTTASPYVRSRTLAREQTSPRHNAGLTRTRTRGGRGASCTPRRRARERSSCTAPCCRWNTSSFGRRRATRHSFQTARPLACARNPPRAGSVAD